MTHGKLARKSSVRDTKSWCYRSLPSLQNPQFPRHLSPTPRPSRSKESSVAVESSRGQFRPPPPPSLSDGLGPGNDGRAWSVFNPLADRRRAEAGSPGSDKAKGLRTDCAICLGEFEDEEWLEHLPRCKHAFHITCIDAWFQNHSNCPLCRSLVYDYYHLITCQDESPVSSQTLLQTLRREDFSRERESQYQIFRLDILHNLDIRIDIPGAAAVPMP